MNWQKNYLWTFISCKDSVDKWHEIFMKNYLWKIIYEKKLCTGVLRIYEISKNKFFQRQESAEKFLYFPYNVSEDIKLYLEEFIRVQSLFQC